MKRNFLIFLSVVLLTGCVSGIWTGANLIYDRHNVYKKLNDTRLAGQAQKILFEDRILKQPGCNLDLTVFHGEILLIGYVPNEDLRALIKERLEQLGGYRRLYNKVVVSRVEHSSLVDAWITGKIRSKILSDSSIDPNQFKIITADRIVYLLGDVHLNQGKMIIEYARNTEGVARVVTLLHFYTEQNAF